ncbi:MAG TPA: AAA family ATPase [Acetobacteraceae bacterium]|nr:AAA family ATPase [Acetobacteraceae bacterium]
MAERGPEGGTGRPSGGGSGGGAELWAIWERVRGRMAMPGSTGTEGRAGTAARGETTGTGLTRPRTGETEAARGRAGTGAGASAAADAAEAPPLRALPAALPDPAALPPREWLYGTRLIRRFVSVLVAPGGAGKSAVALAEALSLATGRPLLGETVHHSVPVWVLNLEDPPEETERRVAALMLHHRIPRAAVEGRLFLHSGRTRAVSVGQLRGDGAIIHPDRDAIAAEARARGIGLIVVDPFVKSHALDENSNRHMDAAATAWAAVAEASGAAVLLVHHVRKAGPGGGAAGDVESARGGKALTDAARSAATLSPMSETEAEELGVPAAERWRHIRLDDAKANLAPRATEARWVRLETVTLGNGTQAYPNGDCVAAATSWRPGSVWQRLSVAEINQALDQIAAGPGSPPGSLYGPHRRGAGRWAGQVLVEGFGLNPAQAARVIAGWLESGLLVTESFRDTAQRKTRLGVRVVDARRPGGRA